MASFVIRPGPPLEGTVTVGGAKNSTLKLMAATLLAEGEHTLHNVPRIADVETMCDLLVSMGVDVARTAPHTLVISRPAVIQAEAPYELVERMRASIVVLGPLLARLGEARVAMPGGDDFGSRPIDMHLAGLEQMGATFTMSHGFIEARPPQLLGTQILLEFPSVGATENILMAAVLAKGTTVIDNAAREPEIADLCHMLEQMGAKIGGAGSSTLEIEGTDRLSPTTHVSVPDRIVAGTWAYAAAMTRGDVTVRNGRAEHLEIALDKLVRSGATIDRLPPVHEGEEGGFRVRME